jgi:hypothetical protein
MDMNLFRPVPPSSMDGLFFCPNCRSPILSLRIRRMVPQRCPSLIWLWPVPRPIHSQQVCTGESSLPRLRQPRLKQFLPAIVMPEFGCAETRPAEFQDRLRCLGPLFASCSGWIFRSAERARHRFNPTIQIPTCGCVVVYVAACPSCVHSNINQIPSIIPGVSHVARPVVRLCLRVSRLSAPFHSYHCIRSA